MNEKLFIEVHPWGGIQVARIDEFGCRTNIAFADSVDTAIKLAAVTLGRPLLLPLVVGQ